jgi:hypothetical protein
MNVNIAAGKTESLTETAKTKQNWSFLQNQSDRFAYSELVYEDQLSK